MPINFNGGIPDSYKDKYIAGRAEHRENPDGTVEINTEYYNPGPYGEVGPHERTIYDGAHGTKETTINYTDGTETYHKENSVGEEMFITKYSDGSEQGWKKEKIYDGTMSQTEWTINRADNTEKYTVRSADGALHITEKKDGVITNEELIPGQTFDQDS